MRFHALCHAPFEGPAHIQSWILARGHSLQISPLWQKAELPRTQDFDFLVIMGGPMNIYEEEEYPWLKAEKKLIAQALERRKTILGVCLGAQLLADVLGGKVYRNSEKEIGWFPVELTKEGKRYGLFGAAASQTVFHWHGDTFQLPPGAVHLARSAACENQAFIYEGRAVGLQFHIESTPESVELLVRHCGNEITRGKFIQSESLILSSRMPYSEMNKTLDHLLDSMTGR